MKKFQEIINGNLKIKDHGKLPGNHNINFRVCEYALDVSSEGIRQSLLRRWISIADYQEAGGVFNLPLDQNESHIVSNYDSQIKVATGLNNCTSLIVAGEKNSFVTHNNIEKIIKESQREYEQLLAECFGKIQDSDDSNVDIFIAGGNYFSHQWMKEIADEQNQDIREKQEKFGFSENQIKVTIDNLNHDLNVHSAKGVDNRDLYLESINFLTEQIKKSFGEVDPLILGCNRIPTSTDVIVKNDQIIVVKPLQILDSLNKSFKASEVHEVTKKWSEAENELLQSFAPIAT